MLNSTSELKQINYVTTTCTGTMESSNSLMMKKYTCDTFLKIILKMPGIYFHFYFFWNCNNFFFAWNYTNRCFMTLGPISHGTWERTDRAVIKHPFVYVLWPVCKTPFPQSLLNVNVPVYLETELYGNVSQSHKAGQFASGMRPQ